MNRHRRRQQEARHRPPDLHERYGGRALRALVRVVSPSTPQELAPALRKAGSGKGLHLAVVRLTGALDVGKLETLAPLGLAKGYAFEVTVNTPEPLAVVRARLEAWASSLPVALVVELGELPAAEAKAAWAALRTQAGELAEQLKPDGLGGFGFSAPLTGKDVS